MSSQASDSARSKVEQTIISARKAIGDLLDREPALRPQCIRIAFYDAISYNPTTKEDGPNGSIRMWEGLEKDEGMKKAIGRLDDLKASKTDPTILWQYVSYGDLYQLAGIEAVAKAGGPAIPFQYGRTDSYIPKDAIKIHKIDDDSTATSMKDTFHRIGFTDKEIVALSSAYYYWLNCTRSDQPKIDNSYYVKLLKEESEAKSKSPTNNTANTSTTSPLRYWKCLLSDASFRRYVEEFAKEPAAFEKAYANAHKNLSELGFKHFPHPVTKEVEYHEIKHGIAFAVAMTILFGFVGFFYEAMRT